MLKYYLPISSLCSQCLGGKEGRKSNTFLTEIFIKRCLLAFDLFDIIDLNVECPEKCNVDNNVAFLVNVVRPETFVDDTNGTILLNVVRLDMLHVDNNVAFLFNVVKPDIFNADIIETLLFSVVNPDKLIDYCMV